MGNIILSGPPTEILRSLNLDISNFPPWICMVMALGVDIACTPLMCRNRWRDYVPFGLAEEGNWFAEEFNSDSITSTGFFSPFMTFDEFRTQHGFDTQGKILGAVESYPDSIEWLKSLYQYMFLTPSTSLANLFTPTALSTLFVLVLCLRAIKSVCMPRFRNVGRQWALKTHGKKWLESNEERIVKFGEYINRLCYHSFISFAGIWYFWNSPWWNEDQGGTVNLYDVFDATVAPGMCWYYLMQAAYNVDAIVGLCEISFQIRLFPKGSMRPVSIGWSDTVRSDFNEMMIHHVVTNSLIFLSSYFRQTRFGSMVFLVHDVSDVPVDLAKLANFVKWKEATAAAFFLLCSVWMATRLYIFPFKIWRSLYTESIKLLVVEDTDLLLKYFYTYQPMFLVLLGFLVLLHLFWFVMLVNIGVVLITKGEARDYREGERDGLISKANGGMTGPNGMIAKNAASITTGAKKD